MDVIIIAIIILIVAALAIYAVDQLLPQPHPLNVIIKVLIILVAALAILQKAGLI